jgi:hypothetical protein
VPHVITRELGVATPETYELGATETLNPRAIFAHFDGAAAAGPFLPCVTYYTQDGLVFARSFPADEVAAGASADVSWFPGLRAQGTATPGTSSRAIEVTIDGGGSAIPANTFVDLELPFGCTITGWTLLADRAGSIVVDIWKDTYANFPPTIADSITGASPPTITAASKATSSSLAGWTVDVNAGDTLRFNVNSAATIQRVTLTVAIVA